MSNHSTKRQKFIESRENGISLHSSNSFGTEENADSEVCTKKSRQTLKRKIRATGTTSFGNALQSLLATDASSVQPLSLKSSISRRRNDEKLVRKAMKALRAERRHNEEIFRIKDIIGGWGAESERVHRKVAQRGVVKLFNAIQQCQTADSAATEKTKEGRGSLASAQPVPVFDKTRGKFRTRVTETVVEQGSKGVPVDKNDFLDMIRTGATVPRV